MKNIILIWIFLLSGFYWAHAQEFKTNTNQVSKVSIDNLYGGLSIQESGGTELIITINDTEIIKVPEKAKGLKPIGSGGKQDNTTIGLNVEKEGNILRISGALKKSMDAEYTIKIPKGLSLILDYHNPFTYGPISIDGFSSEIEITTLHDDIKLKNVTGPLVLHAISGNIDVDFATVNQNSPISITAISGDINIKMPASTPANLKMGTMNGEIFTDFDIKFEHKEKEGLNYIGGGQDISGTLNNGGVEITLKTMSDNIYLRKK